MASYRSAKHRKDAHGTYRSKKTRRAQVGYRVGDVVRVSDLGPVFVTAKIRQIKNGLDGGEGELVRLRGDNAVIIRPVWFYTDQVTRVVGRSYHLVPSWHKNPGRRRKAKKNPGLPWLWIGLGALAFYFLFIRKASAAVAPVLPGPPTALPAPPAPDMIAPMPVTVNTPEGAIQATEYMDGFGTYFRVR